MILSKKELKKKHKILTAERKKKIKKILDYRQRGLVIVLEDIYDVHNALAVLRSADAFGLQNVYFIFDKQKKFNPYKIGKSSSSTANKWLNYKFFKSSCDCINYLKDKGYKILATVLDENSEDIFDFKLNDKKIAVFLGNEKKGLSREVIKNCDYKLYIPMTGMVQSLNISVTAGIVLYEITRQRKKRGVDLYLDKKEKQKIYKEIKGN